MRLLAAQFPGDWPEVSDQALLDTLETWLAPFMAGMKRWSDLASINLVQALNSLLDYPQQQQLEELAPKVLTIPTGQNVTLDYSADNGRCWQPSFRLCLAGRKPRKWPAAGCRW